MNKVTLGSIISLQKGKKPKNISETPQESFLPYVDIKAFEQGIFTSYTDGEKCVPCEDGDLLIVCDGSRSGLVGRAKKGYVGSTLAKISAQGMDSNYLTYFLQGKYQTLNTNMKGTGTPHVNPTLLKSFTLVAPSIPEQERIVQKIEELFSELDKGVMELKAAQARLKVYRQAVLKDAFKGNMVYDTIKNQTSLVTSGSRGWAKYHSSVGAKFIRIGNLTHDKIYLNKNKIQHVILPNKAEGVRSKLEKHDVLISITADLGSIAFIHDDIGEAYINQHIALVRFNNETCAKYYAYYLKSEYGQKELLKNKRGAGKLGLGLDDIRNTKIPIVEKNLCTSIVEHIESRLSVCDNIEQNIEASLEKAESLRQSILKKAFEGKLV